MCMGIILSACVFVDKQKRKDGQWIGKSREIENLILAVTLHVRSFPKFNKKSHYSD